MSLTANDTDNEQNDIRNLQLQLESTNGIVQTLSKQLTELREQVSHWELFFFVYLELDYKYRVTTTTATTKISILKNGYILKNLTCF